MSKSACNYDTSSFFPTRFRDPVFKYSYSCMRLTSSGYFDKLSSYSQGEKEGTMKKYLILIFVLCFAALVSVQFGQEYFSTANKTNEFIAVPAVAFHGETGERSSHGDGFLYEYLESGDDDGYAYPGSILTTAAFAPVYFPESAKKILGLKARIWDGKTGAMGQVQVALQRKDLLTDITECAGVVTTAGNDTSGIETREAEILDGLEIDNSRYAWYLMALFSGSNLDTPDYPLQIHAVFIEYDTKGKTK